MNKIAFSTDLHCEGCVNAVKPILDGDERISSWKVDLKNHGTLTLEGTNLNRQVIDQLLQQAGYHTLQSSSFWTDTEKWRRAVFNTVNCLIGCSIGDFGMVFFLQAFYPATPMWQQMILAIIAGLCTSILLETILLKTREQFSWSFALKTAFGMSFISMVAMEIAMTATDFMITGGEAAFSDPTYWLALIPALIAGFITPLPYNYYKLKKFNQACH